MQPSRFVVPEVAPLAVYVWQIKPRRLTQAFVVPSAEWIPLHGPPDSEARCFYADFQYFITVLYRGLLLRVPGLQSQPVAAFRTVPIQPGMADSIVQAVFVKGAGEVLNARPVNRIAGHLYGNLGSKRF